MNIKEMIRITSATVLSQLSVRDKEDTIRNCIYLGLIELYKRFNLSIQSEVIRTVPEVKVYDLRNTDISQILAVYDSTGKELTTPTTLNDTTYDYKQLNYRSFVFTKPKDEEILVIYKASPEYITDSNDTLDIPTDFMPVLLDYVAYRCHSTINKDNLTEANVYFNRFELGCKQLEQQGYKVNLSTASIAVKDHGFI